jgi:hypothetical protein
MVKNKRSNKITIGFLISLCSKNQNWKCVGDIDLFKNFFVGFINTYEPNKFRYRFFVGYDDNDEFIKNNLELIKKRLGHLGYFTELKGCNGNPCKAWNILLENNIDNADYFYQIGSDICLGTPNWSSYFVNILKKHNNIGICGGVDKGYWVARINYNQNGIIENGFFHKTHYKIFKTLFNKEFKSWYSDDYLARLYYNVNRCFLCPIVIYWNCNRVGQEEGADRYIPDLTIKDKWKSIADKDSIKLKEIIDKLN